MKVTDLITGNQRTAFSFEVLPPLKGTGVSALERTVDTLREFAPAYINITKRKQRKYFCLPADNNTDRLYPCKLYRCLG